MEPTPVEPTPEVPQKPPRQKVTPLLDLKPPQQCRGVDQFGAARYKNPQNKAPWSNGAVPVNRSRLNSPRGNLPSDRVARGILHCERRRVETVRSIVYAIGVDGRSQVMRYDHDALVAKGLMLYLFAKPGLFRMRRTLLWQMATLFLVALISDVVMRQQLGKPRIDLSRRLNSESNSYSQFNSPDLNRYVRRKQDPIEGRRTQGHEDSEGMMNAEGDEGNDAAIDNQASGQHQDTGALAELDPEEEKEKARKKFNRYWKKQVQPLFDLSKYINSLCSLVLSLFLGLSLQRWWALRAAHVQGIMKAARNLAFSMAAVVAEPQFDEVRRRMSRRCILSFALVFACQRGDGSDLERLEDLYSEGLLSKKEIKRLYACIQALANQPVPPSPSSGRSQMSQSSRSSIDLAKDALESLAKQIGFVDVKDFTFAECPLIWNCAEIHVMFKAGAFPPPMLALLHKHCLDCRSAIEGIAMMLSAQLPYTYVHLICMLAHFATLISAVTAGITTALADTNLQICCQAFSMFCLCTVFLGILSLTAVIQDPFGDDILDFPFSEMQRQLARGCRLGGERCFALQEDRVLKNLRVPGDKRPEGMRPWRAGDVAPNPNPRPKKIKAAAKTIMSQNQLMGSVKDMRRPSSENIKAEKTYESSGNSSSASASSSQSVINVRPSDPEKVATRNTVSIVRPEGAIGDMNVDMQSRRHSGQSDFAAVLSAPEMSSFSISQPSSSSHLKVEPVNPAFAKMAAESPDLSSVLRVTHGVVPHLEASLPGQAPCTPQARPALDPQPRNSLPIQGSPSATSIMSVTPDRVCPDQPPEDLIIPLPLD